MSTYAVADLHGCYKLWRKIRDFLKEEDRLYILGDCIDRNKGGLAILTEAITDPRIIVLCGNHEDMMLEALSNEIIYDESDYWVWRWFQNGGEETYIEWCETGRDFSWIQTLKNLPIWAEYTNPNGDKFLLSHSGAVPKSNWGMESLSRKTLLWDRSHLTDASWHRADNEFCVHGHTPIVCMPFFKGKDVDIDPGPCIYCNAHKINLDNGAAWTSDACLFNLDTFEHHIFTEEK